MIGKNPLPEMNPTVIYANLKEEQSISDFIDFVLYGRRLIKLKCYISPLLLINQSQITLSFCLMHLNHNCFPRCSAESLCRFQWKLFTSWSIEPG